MQQIDYKTLKTEIETISKIAASVPEAFQLRCFEILLSRLLDTSSLYKLEEENTVTESIGANKSEEHNLKLNAKLRAFMKRHNLADSILEKIVMMESNEVYFLAEPSLNNIAKAQIEWSLLLALRSALRGRELIVDVEDVRSICQEKGCYDRSNFARVFKKPNYVKYFRNPPEAQSNAESLSNDGEAALANLIKSLASKSEK